jgi:PAS domain S-box-containing protein
LPLKKGAKVRPPLVSVKAISSRSSDELLHDLHVHQLELEMQNEELRAARIALEEARDRFIDLYDYAPVGYVTLNREGLISEINLTGSTLLGVDRASLINRRFATLVAAQDCDHWYLAFIDILSSQRETQSFDLKMKRADGSTFDAHLDCLRREPTGVTLMVRFAFTDISEVKQLQIVASVFNSREGMVVTDAYGVIQRINQTFTELTGYSAKEAIGQKMSIFKSDRHDVDFYTEMWKDVLTYGAWQGEIWNRVKGGESHLHRVTLSAVKDNNNIVTHYVGAYTDITEFKRVEDFEKFRSHILELLAGDALRIQPVDATH